MRLSDAACPSALFQIGERDSLVENEAGGLFFVLLQSPISRTVQNFVKKIIQNILRSALTFRKEKRIICFTREEVCIDE